jgi:type II secretory pathway pseudopilin PulG
MSATTVVGVLIMLAVSAFLLDVWVKASRSADESARRAMTDHVLGIIKLHQAEHGRYPSSLDVLEIDVFPDGSTAATVDLLIYESDASTFSLSCPFHFGPVRHFTQHDLLRD